MRFIAHGDIYDLPPYCECDLDALIVGIAIPNLIQMTVDAITAAFRIPAFAIDPVVSAAAAAEAVELVAIENKNGVI